MNSTQQRHYRQLVVERESLLEEVELLQSTRLQLLQEERLVESAVAMRRQESTYRHENIQEVRTNRRADLLRELSAVEDENEELEGLTNVMAKTYSDEASTDERRHVVSELLLLELEELRQAVIQKHKDHKTLQKELPEVMAQLRQTTGVGRREQVKLLRWRRSIAQEIDSLRSLQTKMRDETLERVREIKQEYEQVQQDLGLYLPGGDGYSSMNETEEEKENDAPITTQKKEHHQASSAVVVHEEDGYTTATSDVVATKAENPGAPKEPHCREPHASIERSRRTNSADMNRAKSTSPESSGPDSTPWIGNKGVQTSPTEEPITATTLQSQRQPQKTRTVPDPPQRNTMNSRTSGGRAAPGKGSRAPARPASPTLKSHGQQTGENEVESSIVALSPSPDRTRRSSTGASKAKSSSAQRGRGASGGGAKPGNGHDVGSVAQSVTPGSPKLGRESPPQRQRQPPPRRESCSEDEDTPSLRNTSSLPVQDSDDAAPTRVSVPRATSDRKQGSSASGAVAEEGRSKQESRSTPQGKPDPQSPASRKTARHEHALQREEATDRITQNQRGAQWTPPKAKRQQEHKEADASNQKVPHVQKVEDATRKEQVRQAESPPAPQESAPAPTSPKSAIKSPRAGSVSPSSPQRKSATVLPPPKLQWVTLKDRTTKKEK